MHLSPLRPLCLLLPLVLGACVEDEPAPIVPTDQLEAFMEIRGTGQGETRITVLLRELGRENYYRIHGTHDTRKIGRRSSNGCIGLYNEHIADLFERAKVGTQVLLI